MVSHGVTTAVVGHVGTDPAFVRRAAEAVGEGNGEVTVRTVADSTEARARFTDEEVDCLVCEASLPEEDGVAVLERLRETVPDVPAVLVTHDATVVDSALAAGARDVVVRREEIDDAAVLARRLSHALEAGASTGDVPASVVDALDDVFYLLDTDGTLQRWNESLREATGYTDEELAGMHALDFFEGDDEDQVADSVATVLEGYSTKREVKLVDSDGGRMPVEFTGTPVTDANGAVEGIVGVGRDITERKEREEELAYRQALLEAISENTVDGLLVVDDDENVLYHHSFGK